MSLERNVPVETYADRDLQEELNKVQAEFDTQMQQVFGMRLVHGYQAEAHASLDANLILDLIKKGKETLEKQRQLLMDADKIKAATVVDVSIDQNEIILTDLERAHEFLDDSNPRKNSESMRKVWGKLVE